MRECYIRSLRNFIPKAQPSDPSSPVRTKRSMRLSYVLFLAAASLVATIDTTLALENGATLPKPNVARIANAHEIIGHDSRFLRTHKKSDLVAKDEEEGDDEEEARVFSGWKKAFQEKTGAMSIAREFLGKTDEDIMALASQLSRDQLNLLFNQGKSHLSSLIPDYTLGMTNKAFLDALKASPKLTEGQKGALGIAYLNHIAKNLE